MSSRAAVQAKSVTSPLQGGGVIPGQALRAHGPVVTESGEGPRCGTCSVPVPRAWDGFSEAVG